MFDIKKRILFLTTIFLLVALLVLSSCASTEEDDIVDVEPQYGGVLHIAYGANPPDLDLHHRTSGTAGPDIAHHMFEYLVTWTGDFTHQLELAESHSVTEDGLLHTFKLREGVLFHNGKELTSEDVVASAERFVSVGATPPELAEVLDSVEATGKYTVEFRLNQPHGCFFPMIDSASLFPIIPKELAEKYPASHIPSTELIGTGPYKIKEHVHDRHVHMVRFEDYVSRDEAPDGYGGKKFAYVDQIIFHVVPDQSVRLMGVKSGQFHFAYGVEYNEYDTLLEHPAAIPVVKMPYAGLACAVNSAHEPTSDIRIRQAIQAALEHEEILEGALFSQALYRVDCGFLDKSVTLWATEAGCQYHNQADPEKSRTLMEEAGYDGEPVIVIGMTEFGFLRDAAIILAHQLENVGFNVDLRLTDQGTWVANYLARENWHLAVTIVSHCVTPTFLGWTRDVHVGWWEGETPRKKELGYQLRSETDHEKRFAIWEELQELRHKEAAGFPIGAAAMLSAAGVDSGGWSDYPVTMHRPRYWNVWIK